MCFIWAENQTPYKKLLMGKKWKKVQKTTERVYHDLSFKDVHLKLVSMKKLYITWIWSLQQCISLAKNNSTPGIGEICYLGYSENMTQQYKFESQSSHFNKKQFSLHCTVKHLPDSQKYIYYLSNAMTQLCFHFNCFEIPDWS